MCRYHENFVALTRLRIDLGLIFMIQNIVIDWSFNGTTQFSFKRNSKGPLRPGGAPPYMIFVFWWYVNHLWCNLNTLGPLTKIWIFLPFRPVRLPWQPGLCAEKLVLGHFWGAKSEKLKKVLENLFLIIKQKMNIKLFTEGFLEILKKKFFFNFHWLCCRGRAIFGQ